MSNNNLFVIYVDILKLFFRGGNWWGEVGECGGMWMGL